MNPFAVTSPVEERMPRQWRIVVVALCTLTLCSCHAARLSRAPAGGQTPLSAGVEQTPLPDPDANGLPPALPYSVAGPWAPPGIAQPWPQDEYLADGGDLGAPAGVAADGHVVGLEAQDTIAHYDTLDGRTLVEPSNRVHLYSPRFRAVRQVVSVQQNDQFAGPSGVHQPVQLAGHADARTAWSNKQNLQADGQIGQKSLTTFRTRQWGGALSTALGPRGFQDAFLPFEDLVVIRTGEYEASQKASLARGAAAAIAWSSAQAVQVILDQKAATALVQNQQTETVFSVDEPPARPKLRVIKVASTPFAGPGEEVDFTIRFDNVGNQAVGNVTILDNLTARLEFVPGSAQASVPAGFSAQANQAESLVLRWEITDPLQPGQGGILRFRCRVR